MKSERRTKGWRGVVFGLLSVVSLLGGVVVAAEAQPGDGQPPAHAASWDNGERAIGRLGDRLPDVARAYGLRGNVLRSMFLEDETLFVDERNELLYVEPAFDEEVGSQIDGVLAESPPTIDPVFSLASRPSADHTIYLDFDGHESVGTSWNNSERPTIVSPPYDTDGDTESWSNAELSVIRAAFEAVAEDFAPFDVNVTTAEPNSADLAFSGSGDQRWGTRVVITRDTAGLCGCGGIAYIGSFDDRTDEPVFVFNTSRTGVIEAISHEVGHAMLLAHDGQVDLNTYYRGHGAGEQSWGPIMGAAYNRTVTQWSKGEYHAANNIGSGANYGNGEDDVEVIASLTNGNGFGFALDDHGDDTASATPVGSGQYAGTISTMDDIDAFVVRTQGGLRVDIAGHPTNPNLDPSLTVRDFTGSVVGAADSSTLLTGVVDLPLAPAGDYWVFVDGTGWGTPLASSPSGWTDYGSLGNYVLTVEAVDGPPDIDPPTAPSGLVVQSVSAGQVTLAWNPNGEPDLASYTVERSADGGSTWAETATAVTEPGYADTAVTSGTAYAYRVRALDTTGNSSGASSVVIATTDDPPVEPVAPNVAVAENAVSGSVSGEFSLTTAADGAAQVISESHSGGRPSRRHDLLDHRWQIDVTDGNHVLSIDADVTDGGDLDSGFAVSWSASPSGPWTELGAIDETQGSFVADLGTPSGTVYVRITDTDRTARNTGYDRVAIDLLQIGGGEPPTDVPVAVTETSPVDGATDLSTAPTLSWTPASGASSYRVTIAGDVNVAAQTTTGNSVRVEGLTPGVTYQWQVEAINELGSTVSQVFRFTTTDVASAMSVDALSLETESVGRGNRRAVVTVVVRDGDDQPVSGAVVSVVVSGSFGETVTGSTDASGVAVLRSTGAAKKPSLSACVASVSSTDHTWAGVDFAC